MQQFYILHFQGSRQDRSSKVGFWQGFHTVLMYFQYRNGWQCQFLEQDLKTSLPRKLHFATSNKVVQLVERAGRIH